MSVARQRARSRKTAKVRNPLSVLATDVLANDNTKVGVQQVRHVTVTARKPIGRIFNAPRIDMGEYSPVATHDLEMEKGLKGWTIEPETF